MIDTDNLITNLSAEITPAKALHSPVFWVMRLLAILLGYAIICQLLMNIRPDLMMQLTRPNFALEIVVLLLLCLSSGIASVLAIYPDLYQKPQFLMLPWILLAMLGLLIISQFFTPSDMHMVLPQGENIHSMECAICIASIAIIPSSLIFMLLRQGASVHQFQAGGFAVLTATSIGCLNIRLTEANDSILHLVQWHYLPTLCFAMLGAFAGKFLLKW